MKDKPDFLDEIETERTASNPDFPSLVATKEDERRVVQAHKHSSQHRAEILRSVNCGCFYCVETFSTGSIEYWTDEDQTAICPLCGIDSVLGDASGFSVQTDFLSQMRKYWFTGR
jgi:hypothetical protein